MLVVRLDSVLEDIIKYESETSGLELTKPALKRLDALERKVDVDLLKISNGDEGDGDKIVERRRRNSSTLKNVCLQALQTFQRPSEADIIQMCKVNAILSVGSEDPFEKFIQQAIEHTMCERTRPILEILDMLEMKVEEYGRSAVMSGVAGPIPRSVSWHGVEASSWREKGSTQWHVNGDADVNDITSKKEEDDKPLVVSNTKVDLSRSQKMIVRITSWRYHTKDHPDAAKIYLDLTKKRIDFLVEATVKPIKDS